jgi:C4-dicarboxylate transporter DctM subunit
MTFALAIVPITLLLLGFPIFLVLLTAVTVALVFFMNVPLAALHQNLFASVNATPLLAVPFFIYAGELMGRGSVAQRLVDFVQGGVGSVRGSLGVTAVGTSAIFGAISGASAATVATIGRVMVPAMRRAGYPETFTAGLITSVGAIDVIIPPSIPMIVYGAAAEESVARLYAAGVIPGLMIAAMIALYVVWRARRENFGAGEPFDRKRFLHATGRSLWALGAPVIILGGIYGGVFSPTEAAAVTCVYAGLVTTFVFRELGWRDIIEASASTVLFTGQILIIVACAGVFAWLLTVNQVPATITAWLQSLNVSAWMLLLAINILLLVVGCFLDPLSAILLLSPLLVPMVKAVGINTVHFGIVVTVNLAIGLFHPPFGINIFVAQSVLGQAWRHSGLAAARRGVAGDAEPDDRWNGGCGGAFRCVQVLRHRQADDLYASHLVRRAGRGQPAVPEIARTGA